MGGVAGPHTAVDARDGSALKFVGVKHAEDPETGKVTSDWNEAYDFSTWMYERPANATKYPVLDSIDQNELLHLNKTQMPSAAEMQTYESARKLVAGDDRNADRKIGGTRQKNAHETRSRRNAKSESEVIRFIPRARWSIAARKLTD